MSKNSKKPSWKSSLKPKGWVRDILMSTIATTISIVLTFGTAHIIEQRQKRADGRQMAMMVIHDMDNSASYFREMAKQEENNFQQAQYLLSHLDDIDSIGADPVDTVLEFILKGLENQHNLDDSNERIFLSSQDTWKDIDNTMFIDAVQKFYHQRHVIFDNINVGIFWERPIPQDDYIQRQMDTRGFLMEDAQYIAEKLSLPRVRTYIEAAPSRQVYYNKYADYCQMTSIKCKFMMGFTDDEIRAYVEKHEQAGRRVKESALLGNWIYSSNATEYQGFEFFANHEMEQTVIRHYMNTAFTGHIDFKFNRHGTWQLTGDSLFISLNPGFDFAVDSTQITYVPEKKDSVDALVQYWEEANRTNQEAAKARPMRRISYAAFIDTSGDRIQLIHSEPDEDNTDTDVYLTRSTK